MPYPTFQLKGSRFIDSLQITVEEYVHIRTGARHYHIAADNEENVFSVAFRTVPADSTGVAHILEHTVLCGSERFPVRDPFFMMTRRSLNTFMNAFTGSDWTAYPFASKNRKDFMNLLEVYLDAVFFASLDRYDFLQEGHRLEFQEPADCHSGLTYRGIVYNEMKGAMSSPVSELWQKLSHHLYPTTTYHYNSGGDPECIPQLTYEQLLDFYRTHYHPGNAIFTTYGDMDPQDIQQQLEEKALHRFADSMTPVLVGDEQRFDAPLRANEVYALDEESLTEKTHIVMGWLLGKNTDLQELFNAELLASILLDNSASPLRHALETTALGSSPSPLCGLEESSREMCFVCGLEGSEPQRADEVEALIMEILNQVATEGVPREVAEAALHQLELEYREIGGDSLPFGLQIILQALPAAIHDGDPVAMLDIDPVLNHLREQIQNPAFIPGLVRRFFLDNPHRVRLVMAPDANLGQEREAREQQQLQRILESLSEAEREQLVERAALLQSRQQAVQDESILPCVTLEDVPADIHVPQPAGRELGPWPAGVYHQETNGLVYLQAVAELPQLPDDLLDSFSLYTSFVTELGCAGDDYLETQRRMSRSTGGIGASASMRGNVDDPARFRGFFSLGGKALDRNTRPMVELIADFYHRSRFDEKRRIRELVSQKRAAREQSITGSGHQLAMTAATSRISPVSALSHRLRGLMGISRLKQLDTQLGDEANLQKLLLDFSRIHAILTEAPLQFLCVGRPEVAAEAAQALVDTFGKSQTAGHHQPLAFTAAQGELAHQMWITNTQVHFCAKAYPTVASGHPDAAALAVLGGFLRNGYLHRAIREQGGAYGGGASQDSTTGAFRFFSYRDPRLEETLADFDRSVQWLLEKDHPWQKVEEAILGVISGMDKPASPAGEAHKSFFDALYGRTPEHRLLLRQRVLNVTLADLQRVAAAYLQPGRGHIAVVSHSESRNRAEKLSMEVFRV
ncbi:insulinase family protein [Desulfurispirillum indicum]|uniref:insulinase family protein n=1 Tax=Desulfurispirillum indicum TaxID=936456 RepID=UPI001CFC0156|nr:insulinase family protein [Desulfurispirillum indicum]UCZ55723.1 insulinase family protein [Desulfurispirillum indicum]